MRRFLQKIFQSGSYFVQPKINSAGKYHEQIRILDNETGYSYETLFGRYLDHKVTEVLVEDPYLNKRHQVHNLLQFCELLVKRCPNVRNIILVTGDARDMSERHKLKRDKTFSELTDSLKSYNINLEISHSATLHDREIRLDNGWIIKMGRGLDIYKKTEGVGIGTYDLDLRPCRNTTVDIFPSQHAASSSDDEKQKKMKKATVKSNSSSET